MKKTGPIAALRKDLESVLGAYNDQNIEEATFAAARLVLDRMDVPKKLQFCKHEIDLETNTFQRADSSSFDSQFNSVCFQIMTLLHEKEAKLLRKQEHQIASKLKRLEAMQMHIQSFSIDDDDDQEMVSLRQKLRQKVLKRRQEIQVTLSASDKHRLDALKSQVVNKLLEAKDIAGGDSLSTSHGSGNQTNANTTEDWLGETADFDNVSVDTQELLRDEFPIHFNPLHEKEQTTPVRDPKQAEVRQKQVSKSEDVKENPYIKRAAERDQERLRQESEKPKEEYMISFF